MREIEQVRKEAELEQNINSTPIKKLNNRCILNSLYVDTENFPRTKKIVLKNEVNRDGSSRH